MAIADFIFVVRWWGMLAIIGIFFLPLTARIFANFFDKGYVFAKVLGLILTGYLIFLFGILHVLPFTQLTVILILTIALILNILISMPTTYLNIFSFLKNSWKIFLLEELLFFSGIFFWSYIRAHQPDIQGLEKFMDFGFVNSILRSDYFPPNDMWFTPFSINYYYFGHLVTAVLTKLSGIPSFITYNLMLATLFAFTFTCSFSIGMNLLLPVIYKLNATLRPPFVTSQDTRSGRERYALYAIAGGLLTAFLVSLTGNLHTIYTFFAQYNVENPLPFWQLIFSPSTFSNAYWYPNATRFIYNTIHEFPLYSFVVSDLHGHVLDIPVVLLTIAVLLNIILRERNDRRISFSPIGILRSAQNDIVTFPLLAFLLAVMYMTNAWDGIIYAGLTFFVFLFLAYRSKNYTLYTIRYTLLLIGAIIISLPFSLHFKPFVSGIGILCAPEFLTNIGKIGPFLFELDHCQHSSWWQLLILYGFFYFFVFSFIIFLLKRLISNFEFRISLSDIFVLILIFLSTLLILLPEFIYVKDIYPAHYRANTMFKLVYQSFMMLGISTAYIIMRIVLSITYYVSSIRKKILTTCYLLLSTFLLLFIGVYPYFAIYSYYGDLKQYRGLDGLQYLNRLYPSDYQAVLWLAKNVAGQPVILEAQGDSYTDYGRVSTNTGLPTVLGWTVHEWLWRGTYDIPSPRITEVQTLYETADIQKTKDLLKKYAIKLVFIGDLEKQKYSNLHVEKFETLGHILYQNGETTIYQITE